MSVPWRAVLCLSVAVSLAGCAHEAVRPEPVIPRRFARALQVPVETTLETAGQVLEARGFTLDAARDSGQLATTWKETGSTRERYLVTAISAGPLRSVVRAFRLRPDAPRERDSELEEAVAARVEAGLASGAILPEKSLLPPSTPARDEGFYLTRWQDEASCLRKVSGLEETLKPGRVLLIGEQLGSREAPAVVGDVVCQAAEAGLAVTLGLSIPKEEQARIDRYLTSAGTPVDQDLLLEGHFWRRPYQDGRSSRAVFDLIDRVRGMREVGLRVSLVAYDTDEARGSERDAALADVWLKRHAERPEEVLVVLAGNTHVRTVTGVPWDQDFTPMAHHLQSVSSLRVLELGYAYGKRWGCGLDGLSRLDCRVVGAEPERRVADHPGRSPYVRFYPSPTEEGYQGLLFVGALSPSFPALEPVNRRPRPTGKMGPSASPPVLREPPRPRGR